jgi:hypothetical protein
MELNLHDRVLLYILGSRAIIFQCGINRLVFVITAVSDCCDVGTDVRLTYYVPRIHDPVFLHRAANDQLIHKVSCTPPPQKKKNINFKTSAQ